MTMDKVQQGSLVVIATRSLVETPSWTDATICLIQAGFKDEFRKDEEKEREGGDVANQVAERYWASPECLLC